jgi:hypothetical protein
MDIRRFEGDSRATSARSGQAILSRHHFLLWLLVCAILTCSAGTARADNVGPQGGPGGGPFTLQCAPGTYLLGVGLHTGQWVDSIRANCLPYDPATDQFVRPSQGPSFTQFTGGSGGAPAIVQNGCSPERYVSGVKIGFTRDGNRPLYIDNVEVHCRVLSGYGGDQSVCIPAADGCGYGLAFTVDCPPGQAAIGLFGRSGVYVDALGLICAPKPVKGGGPVAGGGGPGIFFSKIVQYGIDHLGQIVGGGQCTDLVSAALAFAGAPPGDFSSPIGDYVWGQKINFPVDPAQPGDILQLVNAKLTGPNGFWETTTQHSAIIESASGLLLHVIDQNAPTGNPVAREDINLGWTLERGSYSIYRPAAPGIKGLVAAARPLVGSVSMTRTAPQAVDVYAAPGGSGRPIGSVEAQSTVAFTEVRPDQWCHVTGAIVPQGTGWVWCGKGFELR